MMTSQNTAVVPIPDSRFYRTMRAGHQLRTGHELRGHLVVTDGIAELVRECCPAEAPLPPAVQRACYLTELANAGGAR